MLAMIRAFFAEREVLEVETPILSSAAATDPHLDSFSTQYTGPGFGGEHRLYLNSSPEFAMKRLLAAGSGDIYQICKVFRQGELGLLHNPEFTMLEWYRLDFSLEQLMDEIEQLCVYLASFLTPPFERITYQQAFQSHLGLDPFHCPLSELKQICQSRGIEVTGLDEDRDDWLALLLTHVIEPELGREKPCFLYHYPPSQAALARVQDGNPAVALRCELYWQGVELANAYDELGSGELLLERFQQENDSRALQGKNIMPVDGHLLEALDHGLPPCSGVALGLDRLLMLLIGEKHLKNVLSFSLLKS